MYIGIDNIVYTSNFFLKDRFKRFTIFEKTSEGRFPSYPFLVYKETQVPS